jgi:hypothetical protein
MLPHSLHLLQPLDVVSYLLLKRYYGNEISLLARSRIHHINKETFLQPLNLLIRRCSLKRTFAQGFEALG